MGTPTSPPPTGPGDTTSTNSSPLSSHLGEDLGFEARVEDIDKRNPDGRVAEAASEVDDEEGDEEMDLDGDVEMGEDVDSSQPLSLEEDEGETSEGEEVENSGLSGEFMLHRGPIRPLLSPVVEGPEVDDDDNNDNGGSDQDGDEDMDDVSSNAIASSSEDEDEDDDDATPSFALQTAPSTRRPPPSNKDKAPIYFGALGRAIAPEPISPALSEAETIILPSSRQSQRSLAQNTGRENSPCPTPTTGRNTPTSARTHGNLRAWRYKDVQLPEELPQTMKQWAGLEGKVRMITPLPPVGGKGVVSDAFVESVRERYEELMVKEQKRVIEVVKKSKVVGGHDDEWEFLTGSDKKSQQINWDGLSSKAIRNVKAIIEVLEYEDFETEMAEANAYAKPPHSSNPEETFKLVKRDDNYWGIGWSFRGSTGKFEDLTEDEMEAYHREVYPKREPGDPKLVLGIMGDDGRRVGEDVLEGPVRMQLKDEIKGIKKKVLGRKPGLLRGGEPGSWPFWVNDEDKHLRDWVLAAQGEA